jgi:hypothetical protein
MDGRWCNQKKIRWNHVKSIYKYHIKLFVNSLEKIINLVFKIINAWYLDVLILKNIIIKNEIIV